MKDGLKQLLEVAKMLPPKRKMEWRIYGVSMLLYVLYSLVFLLNTALIDHPYSFLDMYFSFDNIVMFHEGGFPVARDAHPLLEIIYFPAHWGGILFSLISYKWKGVFCILLFSTLVSISNVYVFRYMKNIIGLTNCPCLLLTAMFGCFSTNITLAFTVESYTMAMPVVLFIVYAYSYFWMQNKGVKFPVFLVLSFLSAGITVTNLSQTVLPHAFENKIGWKKKFWHLAVLGFLFALVYILVNSSLSQLIATKGGSIADIFLVRANRFVGVALYNGEFYEMALDSFFGSPIFFPEIITVALEYERIGIITDYYHHWWQYAIVASLYLLVLWSIVTNYKNRLVHLILILWGYYIFLHVIVEYGISESFIYGAHWVYIIPLLLGWLYKNVTILQQKILLVVFSMLLLIFLINNIVRLTDLYTLAVHHFPSLMPGESTSPNSFL